MPVLLLLLALLALPAAASAEVPEGADWTEAYIETDGQPTLHADVMRPKGATGKVPVILSVGPYFAHIGQTMGETPTNDGPQLRWKDLIDGAHIFERGYALVQVDLRGFGASAGCNDFGGTGEQTDVKRAVEWAAQQPWSNGRVGMWGKSYDGWTEVMALDEKPKGLAAAVIQSPIIDGYRALYQNGIHYDIGWYGTPALYQLIDAQPPTPFDSPEYLLGVVQGTDPACYAQNVLTQNTTLDRDTPFWRDRDLPGARGSDVPVLWSHGFMDANTKPDNFLPVWSTLTGPKQAWFGQWAHDRANQVELTGRDGFFAQAMAWFDRYLKGDGSAPTGSYPNVTLQEGDGKWRSEAAFPPADAVDRKMALRGGSVSDDGLNGAEGDTLPRTGAGVLSVTAPLPYEARLSGVPAVRLQGIATAAPRAGIYALLYDVDGKDQATLISRAAHVVTPDTQELRFELYPEDWTLAAGHRVALLISGADSDWYNPPPSLQSVSFAGGTATLPFLTYTRRNDLEGKPAAAIETRNPIALSGVAASEVAADLPPALTDPPAGKPQGAAPAKPAKPVGLTLKSTVRNRRLRVVARGAGSGRVRFVVRRGSTIAAARTVRARRGVARATFRLRRAGRYRVTATARQGAVRLVARSKPLRVR